MTRSLRRVYLVTRWLPRQDWQLRPLVRIAVIRPFPRVILRVGLLSVTYWRFPR